MGIESTQIKELLQNVGVMAKPPVVYSPYIKEYPKQALLRRGVIAAGKGVAKHPRAAVEMVEAGASLYTQYAQHQESEKRAKKVKKETKRKISDAEERRKKSRLLRRPSRERGIL